MERQTKSVFKAVRMTPDESRLLTEFAEERRTSEGAILRWAFAQVLKWAQENESGGLVSQDRAAAF